MKFTNNHQQSPYEIDATVEMCGVLTKQTHENWRQDEKQHVADLKRDRNMFENLIWCEHSTGKAVLKFIDFELPAAHVHATIWHKTKRVPTDVPCCKIPLFQDRWDNSLHTNPPPSCQPGDDPTDARPSLRVNYMRPWHWLNVFTQSAVDSCNIQMWRQFVLISDSCVVFLSEHVILPSSPSLIQLACVRVCRFLPFSDCTAGNNNRATCDSRMRRAVCTPALSHTAPFNKKSGQFNIYNISPSHFTSCSGKFVVYKGIHYIMETRNKFNTFIN